MADKPGIIHRIITGSWNLVDQSRRAVVNIVFLLIIFFIIKAIVSSDAPMVDSNSILVVKPMGYIVEELDYVAPMDEAIDELRESSSRPPQTLLKDLLKSIELARTDDSISSMLLDLGALYGAEPSKLQQIAKRISAFRTSGKKVYAFSEGMNQSQYYLAAHADEVMIDEMGMVYIEGYGRFNTYFRGAIAKLGIQTHVFKVGTFKSAVEPFIRDNMSDAAKEANLGYLSDLWQSYKDDIRVARELQPGAIQNYSDNFLVAASNTTEDASSLALDSQLVDRLMSRQELKKYLMDEEGTSANGKSYRGIKFQRYLSIKNPPAIMNNGITTDSIAVVVAKGVILNGKQKAGTIGGLSTSALIRKARTNSKIKALVLRVDSPGGSAYASEQIRREILATKAAGKPVVVSMGSYAASGGYWISANADEIWASPTTITGSIGIFGMMATFEKPLNELGIFRDGVGTTKLSGAWDAAKPLRDDVSNAIQRSIENGYGRFLSIVSEGRNMSVEAVDNIAQGRVWSGRDALELGLVDKLGDLEQAISSAATLAGVVNYEVKYIEQKLTSSEQFFKDLFNSQIFASIVGNTDSDVVPMRSATDIVINQLQTGIEQLQNMDDPNSMYAHCLCNLN